YSSPIAITDTTTLRYFARDTAGNSSTVQSQTYTKNAAPVGIPSDGMIFRIDVETSTKTMSGSNVTQINDLSTFQRHAAVPSGGTAPALNTTAHVKPVLVFTSAIDAANGQRLRVPNFTNTYANNNDYTIFMALEFDTYLAGQSQKILDLGAGSSTTAFLQYSIQGSTQ